MEHCLVCGKGTRIPHHWPKTKATGGISTVPLCYEHHTHAHEAQPEVIETLIAKAPEYWRGIGKWEEYRAAYWRWLDRRAYLEAVNG